MTSIVLVRHGQASFGADNYDRLSALGQRQAAATGVQLARAGVSPTRVFSGDLERQIDTASIALKSMGRVPEFSQLSAFNEYDSDGVFEAYLPAVLEEHPDIRERLSPDDYSLLKDRKVFRRLFFPVMTRWIEGHPVTDSRHELWSDFRTRIIEGLNQASANTDENDCVLVFTSGGVISALVTYALNMDPARSPEFNWRTANASITRLIQTDRGLELEGYNNYSHLHADDGLKVTYL